MKLISLKNRLKRSLWLRYSPWLRLNWPQMGKKADAPRIAVVTVNFNTAKYISYLLFSLCRIIGRENFGEIVVVDNGSTDESLDILKALHNKGIITLIANDQQQYHGPGLNQGMRYLASQARSCSEKAADYVLILDSDVIVLRRDFLIDMMPGVLQTKAGLYGEIEQNEYIEGGYAHISSILIDPKQVWHHGITPFEEHGTPDLEFQRSLIRRGIKRQHFPFRSKFYFLHLWNGTLRTVRDLGMVKNRYFEFAASSQNGNAEDFADSRYLLDEFKAVFETEILKLDAPSVVAALTRKERIVLNRPFELLKEKPSTA